MRAFFVRRLSPIASRLRFTCLVCCLAWLLLASYLAAQTFRIITIERQPQGMELGFESETDAYYQVWGNPSLMTGDWSLIRGVTLGAQSTQSWTDTNAPADLPRLYYEVRQVPLAAPQDADGDGIDDLTELDTPFLDPVDPSDANLDQDGDTFSNLIEHRFGTGMDDIGDFPDLSSSRDTDGDGYQDNYEIIHGSETNDALSVPPPSVTVSATAPLGGGGFAAQPHDTIQAALDAAVPYDIIGLSTGVYSGAGNRDLDFKGKTVMLVCPQGPSNCVVDCEDTTRGFHFHSGEDPRSVVMGLTVRRASGGYGGAVESRWSGVTIVDCVMTEGYANYGGALSARDGGTNRLIRCRMTRNYAQYYGGTVHVKDGAVVALEDCELTGNEADDRGGGLYLDAAAAYVTRCVVSWNRAADYQGGGVYTEDGATLRMTACTVEKNVCTLDGGGFALGSGTAVLSNCTVRANHSGVDGGGIHFRAWAPSSLDLIDCTVTGNRSQSTGAGVMLEGGAPMNFVRCEFWHNLAGENGGGFAASGSPTAATIDNCIFAFNKANDYGGAGYLSSSDAVLRNCTIVSNTAYLGAALYRSGGSPGVHSSILWDNGAAPIHGTPTLTYSCIEGGYTGTGNIATNPLFVTGFRLGAASPCIDAGSASGAPATDIDGDGRWDDPAHSNVVSTVDMGVDEFVDTDGDTMSDSWEQRHFGTLSRTGIDDDDTEGGPDGLTDVEEYVHGGDPTKADSDGDGLRDGDEVNIHGTRVDMADTDRDHMHDGWESGHGLDPLDRDDLWHDPDGDAYINLYECRHGSDPTNAADFPAPTFYVDAAATAGGDGSAAAPFSTIQDALDAAEWDAYDIIALADGEYRGERNRDLMFGGKVLSVLGAGGAERCIIDCESAGRGVIFDHTEDERTILKDVTIRRGTADYGGGIYCRGCGPTVQDCVVWRNYASSDGGGVYMGRSELVLRGCLIAENDGADGGGAACYNTGGARFLNCVVSGNRARSYGGGVHMNTSYNYGSLSLQNTVIHGNASVQEGAGLCFGRMDVFNCTITSNVTEHSTGGGTAGGFTIRNSVLWGNQPNQASRSPDIQYCNMQGGYGGDGNIDADPLLTWDHRLHAGSPCIDAGTVSNAPPRDVDNEPRWDDPAHSNVVSTVDMGADEFTDVDGDGLSDIWERRYFGNLSQSGGVDNDIDGGPDGLTHLQEYHYGTDPTRADTDGDGLTDSSEVLTHGTDPLIANTDEDGLLDGEEVAIGSDPLDMYDVKITNIVVSPVFFDPVTNQTTLSLGINWTSDVTIAIHPIEYNIDFQASLTLQVHTNVVRSWTSTWAPGTHAVVWNGRDAGGTGVSNGLFTFSIAVTNHLGLWAEPRDYFEYVQGPVAFSNVVIGTNFNFWANEPMAISYELQTPALVTLAVPRLPYPVVWGEPRDTGPHTEYFTGRSTGDGTLLYADFDLGIKTFVVPENAIVVDHRVGDMIADLQAEAYRILPLYDEIAEIRYELNRQATVEIKLRDPDGNLIALLDPTNRVAGAHSIEWLGSNNSNRTVYAQGNYAVQLTAEDPGSAIRETRIANITVQRPE